VNIGRSGCTTRPESARREKLGTLVSDPSLTGHVRGAGVGQGLLSGCVMRCAVATSPSRGPRGTFRSAFRVLSEATVADAIRWTRCRQALQAGWCKTSLGQCCWSDAKKTGAIRHPVSRFVRLTWRIIETFIVVWSLVIGSRNC